ncbi:MAG: XRE family transcriptional regulator, partial [Oscillospiraceae bacterium]|nr:XRE family transcriptional regulator [Oscillospiraceae bacterium]
MTNIGETLKRLRAATGLPQSEVARLLTERGYPIHLSSVSKWEKNTSLPNAGQFLMLCEIYGVRELTEFGAAEKLNETGLSRLREYDSLLRGDTRFTVERQLRLVRLYDLPASAGTGSYADSDAYEEIELPEDDVPVGTDYAVRVTGDSMEPRFSNGQVVFVRSQETLADGEIGIMSLNGD